MKPIGKYIIIQRIEEQVKTDSGLLLSQEESQQRRYQKGTVVKSGTEVTTINKDDVIYYDQRQTQYTSIQERDVVVVL